MIKLVFCLRRLEHLTRSDFQRYWRETHGPLVRERAKAIGVLRYTQLHTGYDALNEGLRAGRGGPEAYDGVAELWFESAEAIQAALITEDGQRAARELLEDERRFIDLARSPLWIADEHPIVA
ncbi:MAG: EthD domain-containing protein [Deltaproteobacteria bacterium]|nr:EthD domain-containing protein [Deltaproteobacteria bacterium]MBW2390595.1 EthD domain-containing protein [Deltaproteobacteria bacterium]MBW2697838.1 EthD domain-containing protein [Deltaproteobacteria bacterium]